MSKKKVPVSAIILADQANQQLRAAFTSVQFSQEIILVDNGAFLERSDFKTNSRLKIIKYNQQPIIDFSQARNWAMRQAQFDWILFIDSDEEVDDPSHARQVINQAIQTNQAAFNLSRTDLFHNFKLNYGEAGKQPQTRLIKRNQVEFIRPVHETVSIKSKQKPKNLAVNILHRAHPDINHFLNKINHYAQKEAVYRYQQTNNQSSAIFLQLIIFPAGKFIYNYFFKFGFLDQMPGLVYASMMSLHSILVRIHWWQLIHDDSVQSQGIE